MAIKLLVGLGNPGAQYTHTRHNVGFWFIEAIAKHYNATLKIETKFKGLVGSVIINNTEYKLLMPTTFMNLSGESVGKMANFYKIKPEEILVAHDELDFAPGIIRLKQTGGHNCHNGLRSIISHLNTQDFWRLRCGIGKPVIKSDITNYVLGVPPLAERQAILTSIDHTIETLTELCSNLNK